MTTPMELRAAADWYGQPPPSHKRPPQKALPRMLFEAAAEIERLQTTLKQIAGANHFVHGDDLRAIAQNALRE